MIGMGPVSFGCGNGKEVNRNHDLLFLLVAAEVTCTMECLCLMFLVCFFFLFLSVKMHPEANDCSANDLKLVTPLRYSQRIREKMYKMSDAVKDQDPCVSSLEQLGDLESKATVLIHKQSNALQETSAEIEE